VKIVHIVRQYKPFIGGLEFAVHDLAQAQLKLGHEVHVVTLRRRLSQGGATLEPEDVIDGIQVHRINHFGPRQYPVAFSVLQHLGGADIIHVHAVDFFCDFIAACNFFLRKTLILSTHGGFFHTKQLGLLKKFWFTTVTRMVIRSYSAVICVSDQDRARFSEIRRQGLVTIYNSVAVDKFWDAGSADPECRTMVSLSRFSPNKQINKLLDTIAELQKTSPWNLLLIGSPDQLSLEEVKSMIADRNLDHAVEVLVSPSNAQIKARLKDASLFVSASSYEGFGIAAVEALSAGLDIVLNDIQPYRELVSKLGQGTIIDFGEPTEAARKIAEWSQMRKVDRVARKRRLDFAAQYGPAQCADKTVDVYLRARGATERHILGLDVAVMSASEAIAHIEHRVAVGERFKLFFANSHLLTTLTDKEKARIKADTGTLILNDGLALDASSMLLFKEAFPSNLNGSDFMGPLFAGLSIPLKVFFLGARPGVADKAARVFSEAYPQHQIAGVQHGYFPEEENVSVISRIKASGADTIVCAMGNPVQERWLMDHFDSTGCQLGIGVGAYLDFLSGNVARAPLWVRRMRLEWFYRLLLEPKRLAGRYTLGVAKFFGASLKQFFAGHRVS